MPASDRSLRVLEGARSAPLWWDDVPNRPTRAPLDADAEADVAIVGAGFTGLWTAYYLSRSDPSLRVVVLEARHVGFGASGRNGGWCHAELPLGVGTLARDRGDAEAVRFVRALQDTVGEVGRVAEREGIDCGFAHAGRVTIARSRLQLARARADVAEQHRVGLDDADVRLLTADEVRARVAAEGALGGSWSPHAAALQPARLAHGLAAACERRGVTVHEGTRALRIVPGAARAERGTVRAPVVLRATEAYSSELPGQRRSVLPLHSLMIATEPLSPETWRAIGLHDRVVIGDYAHAFLYAQRTADDRIALGGRGALYAWGSRTGDLPRGSDALHHELARALHELFPATRTAAVTHRWSGVLGVARDWRPAVRFDAARGLGAAGGYVGDGVATSNLAGRALAERVTGRAGDAPHWWIDHRSRRWEPEPLRWLGVATGLWLARSADRSEARAGRPSWRAAAGDRLRGKRRR